jgi:hypothetical protein
MMDPMEDQRDDTDAPDERPAPDEGDTPLTPGGSMVLRHDPDDEAAAGRPTPSWRRAGRRETLRNHYRRWLGPSPGPLSHPSLDADVEVLPCGPTRERPFITVGTVGLSEYEATVPPEQGERVRQELLLYLPPDWEMDLEVGGEASLWPFRMLQQLAALPPRHGTYFAPGHSVALTDPPSPMWEGTLLCGVLFARPGRESDEFDSLVIDREPCHFLWVIPVTAGELRYKLDRGFNKLLDLMSEAPVPYVIDPYRACVVTGRTPAPPSKRRRRGRG